MFVGKASLKAPLKASLKTLLKEPLFYFLLVAGFLIGIEKTLLDDAEQQAATIHISAGDIQRMQQRWQKIYFRTPTNQELEHLIQQQIKEEVFYREAKNRGLDENDSAIRNRLYQKLAFLAEGLLEQPLPSEEQLRQFLINQRDKFVVPEKYSLRLKKLNSQWIDTQGLVIDQLLETTLDPDIGGKLFTASMLPEYFPNLSLEEIGQQLGATVLAQIGNAPEKRWFGPVPLQGGEYLLMVTQKTAAQMPEFSQIKDQLLSEYLYTQRQQAEERFYQRVKVNYQIAVALP